MVPVVQGASTASSLFCRLGLGETSTRSTPLYGLAAANRQARPVQPAPVCPMQQGGRGEGGDALAAPWVVKDGAGAVWRPTLSHSPGCVLNTTHRPGD